MQENNGFVNGTGGYYPIGYVNQNAYYQVVRIYIFPLCKLSKINMQLVCYSNMIYIVQHYIENISGIFLVDLVNT